MRTILRSGRLSACPKGEPSLNQLCRPVIPATGFLAGAVSVAIAESAIEGDAAGVTLEIETGAVDSYMDTAEDDGVGCPIEIHSEDWPLKPPAVHLPA
ncbi:hypothetical protein HPB52_002912 [Rhipicephalus sanguineus]|uniref:Uncharacterized protein n=1 Tax=Rhipicephalus sanguineus TaxID=34632 RepID=A0A9D4Q569_RHISA|nr:hypothetical protein HPB52_002912 [Rhipicephalus sanguineus]